MRTLSVVLLSVWLCIFGATQATWITMQPHTFGVLTFVIGLVILIVEFFFYGNENHWFNRRAV
jgi:hypothetical protein